VADPAIPRERHTVKTDVLELTFDSEGGSLVGALILKHAAETGKALLDSQTPLPLLRQEDDRLYVAQTGLVGPAGAELPNHKTPMRWVSGEKTLADGQDSLTVRFESAPVNGVVLAKTYTIKRGAYDLDVKHEVINQGAAR
jgi:YidC/Oxa1 family membrane protein insertase